MTPDKLRAFEEDVAREVDARRVPGPVHLSGGCEEQLIAYFAERFRPGDWVFSTWRSHYHCLLAGIPSDEVRAEVLSGKSITLCFPDHRFFSSAIVGGHLSHAVGVALAIKRSSPQHDLYEDGDADIPDCVKDRNGDVVLGLCKRCNRAEVELDQPCGPHVHCFLGDMAARAGAFHEAREYAVGHDLPVTFICENNFKSVTTDTEAVWNSFTRSSVLGNAHFEQSPEGLYYAPSIKTVYYEYDLTSHWPHSGAGTRTNF